MQTRLIWRTSSAASCWHAVEATATDRATIDDALAAALAPPAGELAALVESAGIARGDFFAHLVPLSVGVPGARDLAQLTLAKCLGRERAAPLVEQVATALAGLWQRYSAERPSLDQQLTLRGRPLQEQWEAYGGGLMNGVCRLAESEFLAEEAQAVLVDPILGGGGAAYAAYNSVTFEAVLANPVPRLPETIRLTWLVSQMNLDLPRYSDCLPRARLQRVAQLALAPIVLAAAEVVELVRFDVQALRAALVAWGLCEPDDSQTATVADEWWQVYSDTRPDFAAALVALDQMLAARP